MSRRQEVVTTECNTVLVYSVFSCEFLGYFQQDKFCCWPTTERDMQAVRIYQ